MVLFTVAVDVNPAEIALLQLKITAIKYLTYEEYLCVLGDMKDSTGKQRYNYILSIAVYFFCGYEVIVV